MRDRLAALEAPQTRVIKRDSCEQLNETISRRRGTHGIAEGLQGQDYGLVLAQPQGRILLQPPDGDNTMIHGFIILLSVLITAVANAGESGTASHYSTRDKDQNRTRTACGPPLRDHGLTAAHKTLPCGSRIRVTNKANGRSTVVTITDRGPFARGRVIDLSMGAAHALGFHGLARVSLNRI